MKRRDVGRALAAAVGGAGATLAGVQLASDEASAQTALALDVAGDSATLGSDESVTAVRLSVDVEWAYDLPDSAAPDTAVVEIAAGRDGEVSVVDSAESAQLFTSAEGSESFDVDLLGDALAAAALAPDSGSRETTVAVEARFRVADSDGDVLARETTTDTAPVTIEREASPSEYGSVGGGGEVTIEIG